MNHSTTLFIDLDVHRDSIAGANATTAKSPIAIRSEDTCRRRPDTLLARVFQSPDAFIQTRNEVIAVPLLQYRKAPVAPGNNAATEYGSTPTRSGQHPVFINLPHRVVGSDLLSDSDVTTRYQRELVEHPYVWRTRVIEELIQLIGRPDKLSYIESLLETSDAVWFCHSGTDFRLREYDPTPDSNNLALCDSELWNILSYNGAGRIGGEVEHMAPGDAFIIASRNRKTARRAKGRWEQSAR